MSMPSFLFHGSAFVSQLFCSSHSLWRRIISIYSSCRLFSKVLQDPRSQIDHVQTRMMNGPFWLQRFPQPHLSHLHGCRRKLGQGPVKRREVPWLWQNDRRNGSEWKNGTCPITRKSIYSSWFQIKEIGQKGGFSKRVTVYSTFRGCQVSNSALGFESQGGHTLKIQMVVSPTESDHIMIP